MAEYIEREKMLEDLRLQFCKGCNNYSEIKCKSCSVDDVIGFVEDLPTADVVEVVRCKDCVSFAYYKEPLKYKGKVWEGKCTVTGDLITDDNFFCRNGIRKMAQQKGGARNDS